MKPWKRARHGVRLKDWPLTGPGGGISYVPYAPEGTTGIKKTLIIVLYKFSSL
jgi:hypothetical protein